MKKLIFLFLILLIPTVQAFKSYGEGDYGGSVYSRIAEDPVEPTAGGGSSGSAGARGGNCNIFADDYKKCFYIGADQNCKEGCQAGYVCNASYRCVLPEETVWEETPIDKIAEKVAEIINKIFDVPENETFENTTCERMVNLLDRLKDKCRINNGICEDGESPFKDSDCRLTADSISCKGDRCIFSEIWFAKILLVGLIFMMVFHKKDYNILIFLIILLLVLNFVNLPISMDMDTTPTPKLNLTQEQINDNAVMKYGGEILPSSPQIGFLIILCGLYFAGRYLLNKFKR